MRRILVIGIGAILTAMRLPAQLPDLMPPSEPPGFCKSLQSSYFIKSAQTYNLKGRVHTLTETISSDSLSQDRDGLTSEVHYEFLPNGKLMRFAEDTVPPLANWSPVVEEYFYNTSGDTLLRTKFYECTRGQSSVSERWFDPNGYCTQLEFACYDCDQPATRTKEFAAVFDYTLTYHWTDGHTAVARKYQYKTRDLYYERYKNDSVPCRTEPVKMEGDSDITNMVLHGGFFNQLGGTTFTYDDEGRVIKKLVIDRVVKSSMNIDQMTEFVYTADGNVKEIKYSSAVVHVQPYAFVLNSIVRMDYLSFDTYGNWTKCRVSVIPLNAADFDCAACKELMYERTFFYY